MCGMCVFRSSFTHISVCRVHCYFGVIAYHGLPSPTTPASPEKVGKCMSRTCGMFNKICTINAHTAQTLLTSVMLISTPFRMQYIQIHTCTNRVWHELCIYALNRVCGCYPLPKIPNKLISNFYFHSFYLWFARFFAFDFNKQMKLL